MTRSLFPLLLVALLGAGPAWAATEPVEVKGEGVGLDVIQPTLNDLINDKQPFEAKFQNVVLTDQAQLTSIIPDPASLPPGSEVKIQGAIADRPFELKVENQAGRTEVKIEGLTFASDQALKDFLSTFQNANEVKFEGVVAGQRVEAKLEQGRLKVENEGVSGDKRHRGRDGTSKTLNDEHAKDMGKDDLNRHRGRDEQAMEKREQVEKREDLARDRGDRRDRIERMERQERQERVERPERAEHAERR